MFIQERQADLVVLSSPSTVQSNEAEIIGQKGPKEVHEPKKIRSAVCVGGSSLNLLL